MSLIMLSASMLYALQSASASEPDVVYDQPNPNGYKVYLSRAYHSDVAGAQGECDGATERVLSRHLASSIADGFGSLLDRGYRVRLGLGTFSENRARSNSWNSSIHLPLHSNAVENPPGCVDAANEPQSWGTRQIRRDPQGPNFVLAVEIKQKLDGVTPGTGDKTCSIPECTIYSCLEELCSIDAPRAVYSETEYHIWNKGVNFLRDRDDYSDRFGFAIDVVLGYPR